MAPRWSVSDAEATKSEPISVSNTTEPETGVSRRMDVWFFLAFIVFWFALQWWILPKLGVPT